MEKKIVSIFLVCMILTSVVTFTACGNSDESTLEATIEITEITELISDTTEEISSEIENSDDNSIESSFDDTYYKSLLTSGYWIQKSGEFIYTFDDNGSYTLQDYDGNKKHSGVYYFQGTEGSPILCLKSDIDVIEYDALFNSNTQLNLTDESGSKIILNCSSEKPTSTLKSSESTYVVSFETLEENVQYPCVAGWSLSDKQDEINEIFKQDQEDMIIQCEADGCTYSVSFEVKYSSDDLLSIVGTCVTYYDESAHPNNFYMTYNIDMTSGEFLNLSDCIDIENAASNMISNTSCQSVDAENISIQDIMDINSWTTDQELVDYLNDCDMFYYNQDGKICIYFATIYAVGSYSAVAFD